MYVHVGEGKFGERMKKEKEEKKRWNGFGL